MILWLLLIMDMINKNDGTILQFLIFFGQRQQLGKSKRIIVWNWITNMIGSRWFLRAVIKDSDHTKYQYIHDTRSLYMIFWVWQRLQYLDMHNRIKRSFKPYKYENIQSKVIWYIFNENIIINWKSLYSHINDSMTIKLSPMIYS